VFMPESPVRSVAVFAEYQDRARAVAGIDCQTDCPGTYLARTVDCRVSALVGGIHFCHRKNLDQPGRPLNAGETTVSRGCYLRFVMVRADRQSDYCPRPKTFARSRTKCDAAISLRDSFDLDSI